jgi:hypothetical protein
MKVSIFTQTKPIHDKFQRDGFSRRASLPFLLNQCGVLLVVLGVAHYYTRTVVGIELGARLIHLLAVVSEQACLTTHDPRPLKPALLCLHLS